MMSEGPRANARVQRHGATESAISTVLLGIHAALLLVTSGALALAAAGLVVWGLVLGYATPMHLTNRWWWSAFFLLVGAWIGYDTRRSARAGQMKLYQAGPTEVIDKEVHPALYRVCLVARWAFVAFCLLAPLCALAWPRV